MKVQKPPEKEQLPAAVFGALRVEQDGTIRGTYITRDGKTRSLHIYPDRLTEKMNLLSIHVDRPAPEQWGDIMQSFFLACRLAGVKNVNIQTDFE